MRGARPRDNFDDIDVISTSIFDPFAEIRLKLVSLCTTVLISISEINICDDSSRTCLSSR